MERVFIVFFQVELYNFRVHNVKVNGGSMANLDKKSRKVYIALCAIIVLALALRIIFFTYKVDNFKLGGDARNYINMSHQLVDKGIYGYWYEGYSYGGKPGVSNARVTPGYPLFVSAVYAVFHDNYKQITVIRLLQIIIGGLITPLLAFVLVRRLFGRDNVALLTALLVSVYPSYVLSVTQILTEVLALASVLLYFYLAVLGFQTRKTYLNLLAGAAFALQILIRPNILPLFVVPFIYAWFTWFKDSRKELVRIFIYNLLGFAAAMLPWWIRNYVVLGSFILTADAAGNPLLSGTYPYMKDVSKDVPENIRGISKLQADFAVQRIIRGFTTEPLLYFKWYTVGKIQYLFKLPWLPGVTNIKIIYLLVHYTALLFGFLGMVICWLRNRTGLLLNICFVLLVGLALVFVPENRYVYQMMFLLMMAASYFICYIYDITMDKIRSVNRP
jgi:4-amino-4-deoxy-L-arabinose transferase-like glycosyltransferase